MKLETKRAAANRRRTNDDEDGCFSPFDLSSLKHAIDAAKKNTINLSSLSAALSAASREMKQTEKSQRRRVRGTRKKKTKNNKKLLVGVKPETRAELQRWLSNFDESFKQSLTKKCNMPYKLAPKTL